MLGLETGQVNRVGYFPQTGRWADQLDTLRHIDVLQNMPSTPSAELPRLADPKDTSAPLEARARAYLHTNCASCHQPGGGGYGLADYRISTPLSEMGICNAEPWSTHFGDGRKKLLVPGTPALSLIHDRLAATNMYAMHPYRQGLDADGLALIDAWITSVKSCDP